MLYDLLKYAADEIAQIDPMIQVAFWGFVTVITLLYTMSRSFAADSDKNYDDWRLVAMVIMSIFWIINATAWFASKVGWMFFSDFFFFVCSGVLYLYRKRVWSLRLMALYFISLSLDEWYYKGLIQSIYALLSNIVYVGQLLTVSVLFTKTNKK